MKIILTLIFLFTAFNFNAQQNINLKADSLKKYALLIKNKGHKNIYEEKFFHYFPSNFYEMNKLFGFSDSVGPGPLYDYPELIFIFYNLKTIPKDLYYEKYINICINGRWEADNISEGFGLYDKLLQDTDVVLKVLSKKNKEEIKSIFKFLFDGPVPYSEENIRRYVRLYMKLVKKNKKIAELLQESFKELLDDYYK